MQHAGADAEAETDLVIVLEQLVRLVRRLATAGDLSTGAASALRRLQQQGPQRLTELAVAEAVSQPAMTQLMGRLERDGLVRRATDEDDRRAVRVTLTAAGAEIVERRRSERAEALRGRLHRLDPEDQVAITEAVPALARLVAAE